ncbi:hypothetical protein LUZ60_010029 [Juncus effusus]|nr:hypothetical protein LUZ60_010029 [Juncus effusus]
MEFGWKIVVGSIVAFFGAAFGSVGGVGGGGMIVGAAGSTVYYNMRLRHPSLNMPIIDYDLALLFQPMLMLGISIGVSFNVIFADWMVTVLLILIFLVTSTKAFLKGVATWKKETIAKKEAERRLGLNGSEEIEYKSLPSGPTNSPQEQVSSATATFIMTFSASMSAVEYYLLKRFPVPYALYFSIVTALSALIGQKSVGKIINILGRASLIIFILSFTIFISAISLGGIGIFKMIGKIHRHEYMGFENMCKHQV